MRGRIIKGVGGFYTVAADNKNNYVCKARGRFRKDGITPLPGDIVNFDAGGEEEDGYILDIEERRNVLTRPAVANIDQLVIVISASKPKPDLLLVDKMLLQCEKLSIEPILLINKMDAPKSGIVEEAKISYSKTGYRQIMMSALSGINLQLLKEALKGRLSCFAGQSAAGKSSIINALCPEHARETGELSARTERGRHTTRHAELIEVCGGLVVDTPGFSLLEMDDTPAWELSGLYPEMRAAGNCKFGQCLHLNEPGCCVIEAVRREDIPTDRYERYVRLVTEQTRKEKHKYD